MIGVIAFYLGARASWGVVVFTLDSYLWETAATARPLRPVNLRSPNHHSGGARVEEVRDLGIPGPQERVVIAYYVTVIVTVIIIAHLVIVFVAEMLVMVTVGFLRGERNDRCKNEPPTRTFSTTRLVKNGRLTLR